MLRKIVQISLLIAVCCTPAACAKVKPMVGVYYFPGWYRTGGEKFVAPYDKTTDWSEWRGAVAKAAHPRPVCGFYDDSNPKLWGYYNDWMSSHGIDFIAFDWYYNDGEEYISESLDKGFLGNKPDPKLRFCLNWCNHGGYWWHSPLKQSGEALDKMIDLACDKYFKLPNYLRIDGKPVFMIYETDILSSFGNVKTALTQIRQRAKARGYELYLVSVYSGANRAEIDRRKEYGYDAFCAYTYAWMRGPSISWQSKTFDYKDITNNIVERVHPYLARIAKEEKIAYWPSTFSGWDDRPRAGLDAALVLQGNAPAEFGRMFRSGLKHMNPASPVVMVEAWNEWGEGACMEPSKEHGFGYLSQIAGALGIKKTDERVPTSSEISSWSILTPQELKVAEANESKPWPTKPIVYNKLGESRKVAPVKLPVVLDFAAGGVELATNDLKIDNRDANGLDVTTTGGDSQVAMSIPEIPVGQIKRITLEADVTAPAGRKLSPPEVYIATGLLPDYSPFACFSMPLVKDGKSTFPTSEVMFWESCGTPLTKIRIDPCGEPGVKIHLRRVILSGE